MAMQNQGQIKPTGEPTQVRFTGDWSADSKLSSIQNGYWNDPFFEYFNAPEGAAKIPKRTALICRGYYVRYKLCDYFLKKILASFSGAPIQIVVLGCGMDTTYFRLTSDPAFCDTISTFFELDFASVVQRKQDIINSHDILQSLAANKLVLVEHDLRNLETLRDKLGNGKGNLTLDFDKPTLFYSECVVNYLKPTESECILRWITSNVPNCTWLAYEQCYPNDFFGKLMVQHFRKNGCPILSIEENGDMESQSAQLIRTGFQQSVVFNVWDTFVKLSTLDEFKNITPEQQFDEYEAFLVTCLHYSIRVGSNNRETNPIFTHLMPSALTSQSSCIKVQRMPSDAVFVSDMKNTFSTHCSILIDDNKVWVLGGTNKNGTRVSCVTELLYTIDPSLKLFHVSESLVPEFEAVKQDLDIERVHSAAVFVKPLNSLYIFGGRKSPRSPSSGQLICVKLKNENDSTMLVSSTEPTTSSGPCSRWRHTLTYFVRKDGVPCLFLFGGKTEKEMFGDRWIYNCANSTWNLSNDFVNIPSARHSHSVCTCEERESIFLVGGMTSDTEICDDALWEYKYNQDIWVHHSQWSHHVRKIGTAALICKNELLVVGGYGNESAFKLEHFLTIFNLETNAVRFYELNLDPDVFLPFGFSAHLIRSQEHNCDFLAVIGGGGNCFSFGTHYNSKCLLLNMSTLEME